MSIEMIIVLTLSGAAIAGLAFLLLVVADPMVAEIKDQMAIGDYEEALRSIDGWLATNKLTKGGGTSGGLSGYLFDRKTKTLKSLKADIQDALKP